VSHNREVQVLDLVADVCGLLDIGEFRLGLLDALHRVLPSEYVSLNEVGPTPDTVTVIMRPDVAAHTTRRTPSMRTRIRCCAGTSRRGTGAPTASPT
jgi:hypothetical protein